jgi:iron complex transport system substrate-binding protein
MSQLHHLIIIGVCTLILIVACGRPPDSLKSDRLTSANLESCRLVQHEMGETKVCGQPQKIAALSPHILDSILALGVQPVAYPETVNLKIQTYDKPEEQIPYIGKWVTTEPIGLGDRDSPCLERLTRLKPDLILGEYWLHQDKYSLLSQIAPTLLFSDQKEKNQPQSWQQDIEGIAIALGKQAQAEELLNFFEEKIATTRKVLQPVLEKYPRVFLFSSVSGKPHAYPPGRR